MKKIQNNKRTNMNCDCEVFDMEDALQFYGAAGFCPAEEYIKTIDSEQILDDLNGEKDSN